MVVPVAMGLVVRGCGWMFEELKRRAMQRLEFEGIDEDEKLRRVVKALNQNPNYFTTSSCAGRIALIEVPGVGDKEHARFVAKWHRRVGEEELFDAVKGWRGELWLTVQCPIIHVSCRDLGSALHLLGVAKECGFKRSGIISVTEKRVNLEIVSTERADVPMGVDGVLLCDKEYLRFLLDRFNELLSRSKEKMGKLCEKLTSET